MKIVIQDKDIRRDTFRAGGKGGQHQNKTESAVRLTYLPLGISAESRGERSQHQNEQIALKLLICKIGRHYSEQAQATKQEQYESKKDAGFGHQIRSYVLHGSEQRVVDHRTGFKDSPKRVLCGSIDGFLLRYLKYDRDSRIQ